MELQGFNPWWKSGRVPLDLTGRKRRIFGELREYIDKRQIVLFTGLRRVGKTTLMYHLVDELIGRGVNPYHILYFSFDEMRYGLDELVRQYETDVLRDDISKNKCFIFLDEIQKLEGWPSKIKLIYDVHPQLKIFLKPATGGEGLFLHNRNACRACSDTLSAGAGAAPVQSSVRILS